MRVDISSTTRTTWSLARPAERRTAGPAAWATPTTVASAARTPSVSRSLTMSAVESRCCPWPGTSTVSEESNPWRKHRAGPMGATSVTFRAASTSSRVSCG